MSWHTGRETIDGFSLFYRDWRPREEFGLPVLALHGSLTQSGSWIVLAEAMQTIRMLCPDQRGFGLSEDPGSDECAEFASDAIALATKLLPTRYVVMGHSFACSIALEVARTNANVAGVVLVDPVVPMRKPGAPSAPPQIAYADSFATLEDAMHHFRSTEEGAWPDDTLKRFAQDVTLRDSEKGPWRLPYTLERLRRLRVFTASPASDFNLLAKAKDVRQPLLIFRGGASKRFPAEAEQPFIAAFTSKPKLVVCPASGHFPANSDTDVVAAALKRFVTKIS
ncbi:MAG TPA: alpha/beta hydrolase [Pseudolabrys sp.]|nr:alpha/beta hydrolase [Pseudolabrys sp.]